MIKEFIRECLMFKTKDMKNPIYDPNFLKII